MTNDEVSSLLFPLEHLSFLLPLGGLMTPQSHVSQLSGNFSLTAVLPTTPTWLRVSPAWCTKTYLKPTRTESLILILQGRKYILV